MNVTPFVLISSALTAVAVSLLVIVIPTLYPFGNTQQNDITVDVVATTTVVTSEIATSSPPVVQEPEPTPEPKPIPKETIPPVVIVPPPTSTSTESNTVGTTTLAVQSIPLLVGGTVHAGQSVPISYLQITNIGKEGALLKGFWVKQNGSASTTSVTGLSTVDDKGGSRGFSGGLEWSTPFKNGLAFAPTEAFFAPGQMKLFTIKAVMTNAVSMYVGTQLMIDVSSIETTATVKGQFPIRGTTWTISE
jgi:hypothetical protein